MRKKYEEELNTLKLKMEKAEIFAAKLPVFADYILDNTLSGEESHIRFPSSYKATPLHWGINRNYYRKGSNVELVNAPASLQYNQHLNSIYINSLTLFNTHESFGLHQAFDGINIFFSDLMNSTFYVEDEHLEDFLEALNVWYLSAKNKVGAHYVKVEKDNLLKRLAELNNKGE